MGRSMYFSQKCPTCYYWAIHSCMCHTILGQNFNVKGQWVNKRWDQVFFKGEVPGNLWYGHIYQWTFLIAGTADCTGQQSYFNLFGFWYFPPLCFFSFDIWLLNLCIHFTGPHWWWWLGRGWAGGSNTSVSNTSGLSEGGDVLSTLEPAGQASLSWQQHFHLFFLDHCPLLPCYQSPFFFWWRFLFFSVELYVVFRLDLDPQNIYIYRIKEVGDFLKGQYSRDTRGHLSSPLDRIHLIK